MMAAAVRYMCYCAANGADSDDALWLENAPMATPKKPTLLICVKVNAPVLMGAPSGGFFGVMCQLTGGLICTA